MSDWKKLPIDRLRAEITDFIRREQAPDTQFPLPSGLEPGNRSPEQLAQVSENWVTWIMSRPHGTWTPEEREAVRITCARVATEGR